MGLPECRELYNNLDPKLKAAAIEYLKKSVFLEDKLAIKEAIRKDPEKWFAPWHFNWGMHIRNSLRINGFGEYEFNINNLDDIYVELIEDAVK